MSDKKTQIERFKETARQLETDDDEDRFNEKLRKLAEHQPEKKTRSRLTSGWDRVPWRRAGDQSIPRGHRSARACSRKVRAVFGPGQAHKQSLFPKSARGFRIRTGSQAEPVPEKCARFSDKNRLTSRACSRKVRAVFGPGQAHDERASPTGKASRAFQIVCARSRMPMARNVAPLK